MNIDTLCLSSGGIKGLSFISGIQFLIENEFIYLENIKNYYGTSIGAIISFLFVIGYKPTELIDFFRTYDFKSLEPEFNLDNLFYCERKMSKNKKKKD